MRERCRLLIFLTIISLALSCSASARQRPRRSPHESVSATIQGTRITITYGRPYMRGRTIWGGLLRWNQVWAIGADQATIFETERTLQMGDTPRDVRVAERLSTATFAGGCFWSMERTFDETDGVVSTTSGYTGGSRQDPTYSEVSAGGTGHAESVRVVYDPKKISYQQLLDVFWHNIDPTDASGQFCDRGHQYRTMIFYHDETQKRLAERSKKTLDDSGRLEAPIVTQIAPGSAFYPAEEYHQDYHRKNPLEYRLYRFACGRDRRLHQIWGKDGSHAGPV